MERSAATLWEILAEVPDHREKQGRRYGLRSMLGIAIAAVLSGRDGLAGIARWGRGLRRSQLEEFDIHRGQSPCHATWHNVFKGLDVKSLESALGKWVTGDSEGLLGDHFAMDGKELRGSKHWEYPGLRLLSIWSQSARGVVGQLRVSDKSNEISAALKLLKKVPLKGVVVTGDAMFCQKRICERIVSRGGDYFLIVKDNQEALKADIKAALAPAVSPLREATA